MNISIFNYSLEMGGADKVAVDLASIFNSRGHGVDFVTLKEKSEDFFELPAGVERYSMGYRAEDSNKSGVKYFDFKAVKSFIRTVAYLRKVRPDFVISNWTALNVFLILASFFIRGTKFVCVEHMHYDHPSFIWRLLRYIFYRFSYRVVCLTDDDFNDYSRTTKNVVRIFNPVICKVQSKRLHPPGKVFLAAGRLEYQKGFDILINSFKNVVSINPSVILRIAGSGSQLKELELQIESAGMSRNIELVGAVKDISVFYSSGDFFVLSSRFEGFGLVLVEAQMSGLPVISFDCPRGPSEIIDNGVNGILVENGSADKLSEAMIKLLSNPELSFNLAKNGLESSSKYSAENIYNEWKQKVFL